MKESEYIYAVDRTKISDALALLRDLRGGTSAKIKKVILTLEDERDAIDEKFDLEEGEA